MLHLLMLDWDQQSPELITPALFYLASGHWGRGSFHLNVLASSFAPGALSLRSSPEREGVHKGGCVLRALDQVIYLSGSV